MRALSAHLPRVFLAYVLSCQRALRAFRAYVPTCSRAITINNKNKFAIICFLYNFVIVLSFFFLLKKKCYTSLHCSYQEEPFNGCCDRLCKKMV